MKKQPGAKKSFPSLRVRFRWDLRAYFTLVVFMELIAAAILTLGIVSVLHMIFEFKAGLFSILWAIITSTCISAGITAVMNYHFFRPLRTLGQAMGTVAQGDYKVRLPTDSRISDLRQINDNFNRMAQALDSTEMLQSDFVSNVSHEFKTPINAIEGYAMLLQDTGQISAEQQEYIEKILFNTHRLSDLISNVLLLSKLDNQSIPQQPRTFRLDEQIRQAIMMLEKQWTEKDVEFDVELESISYTGNESLLLHVWSNLISNAIKFNRPGGMVRLRLYPREGQLIFTVSDQGPGLGTNDFAHIFEKFYQGDTSHKQEGNGLGLALVMRILRLCAGSIQADNLPEGGCRFTVRLPDPQEEKRPV